MVSAATKAPGMMLVPGWVSMRGGVQLAASHGHLRVDEGGTTLRHLCAVHHNTGAVAHSGFVYGDELHGLLAIP